MENLLDKLIKLNLYLITFLVPIFFLPFTTSPLALNKQMLLSFLALFCLILWLIKIFSEGKFSIIWNKLVILVLAMLMVFGLSAMLSGAKAQSFWGMNAEPDSFFNLVLFGLVFFLFANLFKNKKQILNTLYVFLASAGVLSVLFLAQIFLKKPIFPWDFAQSLGFNPIGAIQALGLFLGAGFVLLAALAANTLNNAEEETLNRAEEGTLNNAEGFGVVQRKVQRLSAVLKPILFVALGTLLFACILLINYWLIWLGLALALVIIMAEMSKSIGQTFGQKELMKFALPLLILVFALIAIFIRVPTEKIIQVLPEVNLTQKASFDIALKTLKETPKNIFLGSGPSSFGYQYSLYHLPGINLTELWQIRFNQGASALLTFLSNSGILGTGLVLLLAGLFLFQGLKMVYKDQSSTGQLAVFVAGAYLFVLWFFYPLNFVLGFSAFLMLGLWTAMSRSPVREFSFSDSPQKAFLTMIMCAVLIVGSVIGMYKVSQKYRAALVFAEGLTSTEIDDAIEKVNQAVALDQKDVYFRNLSELFLAKVNEVVNDEELGQGQKQELFQQIIANTETSANAGIQINPKNSQNWLQLGAVYESLAIYGVEGAFDLAISNYEKTKELDPQNPLTPLSIGRTYKRAAERTKAQIADSGQMDEEQIKQLEESANQNFDSALGFFNESLLLKPNFASAYFLTAQVYEMKGDKAKALENYQIVLELEPGNEEIQNKINELQEPEE